MIMNLRIDNSWKSYLKDYLTSSNFKAIMEFYSREYASGKTIYPPQSSVFHALEATPLDKVSVVILGQDPYHQKGQAHGLAFSVPRDTKIPPSLANIFKEISHEFGNKVPSISERSGDLTSWTQQGVLLLNTVLMVQEGKAGSYQRFGWEDFTDQIIQAVSDHNDHCVFLLWGKHAINKQSLINETKHLVLSSTHPSPLSAYRGFFGNNHFTATNDYLSRHSKKPIAW